MTEFVLTRRDGKTARFSAERFVQDGSCNGRRSGGLPPFRSRRCSTSGDGSRGVLLSESPEGSVAL